MNISLTNCINFSKKTGDKNLIHIDKKFASMFFFKEPIAHGVNTSILALRKFFILTKKKVIIEEILINFMNFINIDEEFSVKIKENTILVYGKINLKIKIDIKTTKNIKKVSFINKILIQDLNYITKLIGTKLIGNGALIHKIHLKYDPIISKYYDFKKLNIRKINKSVKIIKSDNLDKSVQVICSKAIPFKISNKRFIIKKNIKNKIKKKRILVIGPNSDLGKLIIKSSKSFCKISKFSFRIKKSNKFEREKIKLKFLNILKLKKPDYIFYLSSINIFHGTNKNLKLRNLYFEIYSKIFKIFLDCINSNNLKCSIFYPSTFVLNNKKKYKHLDAYISAKIEGEKICKDYSQKNNIYFPRLPQFKSRSNYNILGYYEGVDLLKFDYFFNKFISKNL